MKTKLAAGCAVLAVWALLLAVPTAEAGPFYFSIEGTKQGVFRGESGVAGKSIGLRFQYSVASPRDLATGLATGRRQHQPVVITKEWGGASPQIFQAMATGEVLKTVVFEFMRTNAQGQTYVFQTMRLYNAQTSQIRQYNSVANAGEPVDARALEDISFSFQRIEITNMDSKTTAVDDWQIR